VDDTLILFDGEPRAAGPAALRRSCPSCSQTFSGEARFCPFDGQALVEAPAALPDPLLGKLIDQRYAVEAVLGEGGMGTVYQVRHASLGRAFAMKVLRRELAVEAELAARFVQEARAAARVSHPNVIEITDFGNLETGEPYFVMELLSGTLLGAVIRQDGRIAPARAAELASQIAQALAAAHEVGVIHRDLKPDNVCIAIEGRGGATREHVKVLDFGLAKVAGASRLTRAGMVFGTPHYMSPEQAAGEPIDARSDVYALGVLLYEMVTGKVPFEADTYMGVLTQHMYAEPLPPSRLLEGEALLSLGEAGPLEGIVLKCLAKRPAARYATMDALLLELSRVGQAPVPAPRVMSTESPLEAYRAPARTTLEDLGAAGVVLSRGRGRNPLMHPALAVGLVAVAVGSAALAAWLARTDPSEATRGDKGEVLGAVTQAATERGEAPAAREHAQERSLVAPSRGRDEPGPTEADASPAPTPADPTLTATGLSSVARQARAEAARTSSPGVAASPARGPDSSRPNPTRPSSSQGRPQPRRPGSSVAPTAEGSRGEIVDPWAPASSLDKAGKPENSLVIQAR
jgi:serine/threonine-protein kinase